MAQFTIEDERILKRIMRDKKMFKELKDLLNGKKTFGEMDIDAITDEEGKVINKLKGIISSGNDPMTQQSNAIINRANMTTSVIKGIVQAKKQEVRLAQLKLMQTKNDLFVVLRDLASTYEIKKVEGQEFGMKDIQTLYSSIKNNDMEQKYKDEFKKMQEIMDAIKLKKDTSEKLIEDVAKQVGADIVGLSKLKDTAKIKIPTIGEVSFKDPKKLAQLDEVIKQYEKIIGTPEEERKLIDRLKELANSRRTQQNGMGEVRDIQNKLAGLNTKYTDVGAMPNIDALVSSLANGKGKGYKQDAAHQDIINMASLKTPEGSKAEKMKALKDAILYKKVQEEQEKKMIMDLLGLSTKATKDEIHDSLAKILERKKAANLAEDKLVSEEAKGLAIRLAEITQYKQGSDQYKTEHAQLLQYYQNMQKYQKIQGDIDKAKEDHAKNKPQYQQAKQSAEFTSKFESIKQQTQNVVDTSRSVENLSGAAPPMSESIGRMMQNFSGYMLKLRMVQRGVTDIIDAFKKLQEVEDVAFATGIVSGMDISNIKKYRNDLLMLGTQYKQTALEIGKASEEVVKLGFSFKDADKIIGASLRLSQATYQGLEESASSIDRLMISLDLSGTSAQRIADLIYNITQSTPLNIQSINEALKQTGAAFSGLYEGFQGTGAELTKYKEDLAEIQLTMVGLTSLQGKTASMGGTAIKSLVNALRSPTAKAEKTIDMDFAKHGVTTASGDIMTSKDLSRMTETNFKDTLDFISKMFKEGKMSYGTIQELSQGRNTATVTRLLTQIDGSIDTQNAKYAKQFSLLDDSTKSLESWSTSIDKLKNSFTALSGIAADGLDVFKGFIDVAQFVVAGIAKAATQNSAVKGAVQGTGVGLGAFGVLTSGAMILQLAKADGFFKNFVDSLKLVGSTLFNVTGGLLAFVRSIGGFAVIAGIVVGTIVAITSAIKKHNDAINDQVRTIGDFNLKISASEEEKGKLVDNLGKSLEELTFSSGNATTGISILSKELIELRKNSKDIFSKQRSFDTKQFNVGEILKVASKYNEDVLKTKNDKERQKLQSEARSKMQGMVGFGDMSVKDKVATGLFNQGIYEDLLNQSLKERIKGEQLDLKQTREFIKQKLIDQKVSPSQAEELSQRTLGQTDEDLSRGKSIDDLNKLSLEREREQAYREAVNESFSNTMDLIGKSTIQAEDTVNYMLQGMIKEITEAMKNVSKFSAQVVLQQYAKYGITQASTGLKPEELEILNQQKKLQPLLESMLASNTAKELYAKESATVKDKLALFGYNTVKIEGKKDRDDRFNADLVGTGNLKKDMTDAQIMSNPDILGVNKEGFSKLITTYLQNTNKDIDATLLKALQLKGEALNIDPSVLENVAIMKGLLSNKAKVVMADAMLGISTAIDLEIGKFATQAEDLASEIKNIETISKSDESSKLLSNTMKLIPLKLKKIQDDIAVSLSDLLNLDKANISIDDIKTSMGDTEVGKNGQKQSFEDIQKVVKIQYAKEIEGKKGSKEEQDVIISKAIMSQLQVSATPDEMIAINESIASKKSKERGIQKQIEGIKIKDYTKQVNPADMEALLPGYESAGKNTLLSPSKVKEYTSLLVSHVTQVQEDLGISPKQIELLRNSTEQSIKELNKVNFKQSMLGLEGIGNEVMSIYQSMNDNIDRNQQEINISKRNIEEILSGTGIDFYDPSLNKDKSVAKEDTISARDTLLESLKTESNEYVKSLYTKEIAYYNLKLTDMENQELFYAEIADKNSKVQRNIAKEIDAMLLATGQTVEDDLPKLAQKIQDSKLSIIKNEKKLQDPKTTELEAFVLAKVISDSQKELNDATQKQGVAIQSQIPHAPYETSYQQKEVEARRAMAKTIGENGVRTGTLDEQQSADKLQRESKIASVMPQLRDYNEMFSSLQGIPSIQVSILRNAKSIAEEELKVMEADEKSKDTNLGKVEMGKKRLEILKSEYDIQISILNAQKEGYTLDTQILNAQRERKSPDAKNIDMFISQSKFAKEEFNTKNLEYSLDSTRITEARTARSKDKTPLSEHEIAMRSLEDQTLEKKKHLASEQYITDLYKARVEYVTNESEKFKTIFGSVLDSLDGIVKNDMSRLPSAKGSISQAIMSGVGINALLNTPDNQVVASDISDAALVKANQGNSGELLTKEQLAQKENAKAKNQKDKEILQASISVITESMAVMYNALKDSEVKSLEIKMEGLKSEETILGLRKRGLQSAEAQMLIDEQVLKNADAQYNLQKDINAKKAEQAVGQSVLGMGAQGAQLGGAIGGGPGAAIGGVIGAIAGFLTGNSAEQDAKRQQANADKIREEQKQWEAFIKQLENTANYIANISDNIKKLVDNTIADASKSLNQQKLKETLDKLSTLRSQQLENYSKATTIAKQGKAQAIDVGSTYYPNHSESGSGEYTSTEYAQISVKEYLKTKTMSDEELKAFIATKVNYDVSQYSTDKIRENLDAGFSVIIAGTENITKNLTFQSKELDDINTMSTDNTKEYLRKKLDLNNEGAILDDASLVQLTDTVKKNARAKAENDRIIQSAEKAYFYSGMKGVVKKEKDTKSIEDTREVAIKAAGTNKELIDAANDAYDIAMSTLDKTFVEFESSIGEIYASTIQSGLDSGKNFADSFAQGTGSVIGTWISNTLNGVLKKSVDTSSLQKMGQNITDYLAGLGKEGMKDYFIGGALDIAKVSKDANKVMADKLIEEYNALTDQTTESAKALYATIISLTGSSNDLISVLVKNTELNNLYSQRATSIKTGELLQQGGMRPTDIATALKSAGLVDIFENAVKDMSGGRGTPFGLQSGKNTLNKEEFLSYNEKYIEDFRRKELMGTATAVEKEVLRSLETTLAEYDLKAKIITDFADAFKTGFDANNFESAFSAIGDKFTSILKDKMSNDLMSGVFNQEMIDLQNQATEAAKDGNLSSLFAVQQRIMAISSNITQTAKEASGYLDMFDPKKLIDFKDNSKDVNYTANSTKDVTYNQTISVQLNAGAVIGDGVSLDRLSKSLMPYITKLLSKTS